MKKRKSIYVGKFENYVNKGVNDICPRCGGRIEKINFTPLLRLKSVIGSEDRSFYGGTISRFTEHECTHCEAQLLLFLRNINNSYGVHDIAIDKGVIDEEYEIVDNDSKGAVEDADTEELERSQDKLDKALIAQFIKAKEDGDLELAINAIDNMTFGHVPKLLVDTGFSKDDVYTENHRIKSKKSYIALVTRQFKPTNNE